MQSFLARYYKRNGKFMVEIPGSLWSLFALKDEEKDFDSRKISQKLFVEDHYALYGCVV